MWPFTTISQFFASPADLIGWSLAVGLTLTVCIVSVFVKLPKQDGKQKYRTLK